MLSTVDEPEPRLPDGFPSSLRGPNVWSAKDYEDPPHYVTQLSPYDVEQIELALRRHQSLSVNPREVGRANFPLAQDVAIKLKSLSKIVHKNRGFVVLRGIDPSRYTPEENLIMYCGICSYVARDRADMLHIYNRDNSTEAGNRGIHFPPNERTQFMNFHTDVDAGDILSLFTLGLPESGGRQHLVSFATVYNDLAANEPDVLVELAKNWRYEMPTSKGVEVIDRPVVSYVEGKMQINFATAFLAGSSYLPRTKGSPQISYTKSRAIEVLLQTCRKYSLPLDQKYGDMLFVHNMSVLHAREAFIDNKATGKVRHLLSLMLHDPDLAWPKAPEVSKYIERRFAGMSQPEFFGTVDDYENLRSRGKGDTKPPHPQRHD
ncbi:MAG: hypothetical protein MMC23_006036 [Stictis urceolatum]|nr:hypothetical protein [Stictis urceolata]